MSTNVKVAVGLGLLWLVVLLVPRAPTKESSVPCPTEQPVVQDAASNERCADLFIERQREETQP